MLPLLLPRAPLGAFGEFARHMLHSRDIDPVYPVLRQLIGDMELAPPDAEWLVILYLAYYNLASATRAFLSYPDPANAWDGILNDHATLTLPTGVERRGLRGGATMADHLSSWTQRFNGTTFFDAATSIFTTDPRRNDAALTMYLTGVPFNGRWAAYKGCEVAQKVLGWPVRARDAGHENSTGPREGLKLFFPEVRGNSPAAIRRLDYQTDGLIASTGELGVELGVEEVETLLCDFKSLSRGKYVVGHDIDLLLEGIRRADSEVREYLLHARRALPAEYRGELNGWEARDKAAQRAYVERGEVLHREPPDGRWAAP